MEEKSSKKKEEVGFLGSRETEALTSRQLLLRAGDVEANPGPAAAKCNWCKDPIAMKHLSCNKCRAKFHMRRMCSGLTRPAAQEAYANDTLTCVKCEEKDWVKCASCDKGLRKTHPGIKCSMCSQTFHYQCGDVPRALRNREAIRESWSCTPCLTATPVEETAFTFEEEPLAKAKCDCCKATIKTGGPRNTCQECKSSVAHLKCSGGKSNQWKCCACEHGTSDTPVDTSAELPASQCKDCKRKINRNAPRKQCATCRGSFHIQCNGNTPSERQQVRRNPDWNCNPCKVEHGSRNNVTADVPLPQPAKTPTQDVIRVLQWNAGGIHKHIMELESYLDEEKIDICCLQETKMIPSDSSPCFVKYTVVKRDRLLERMVRGGGVMTLIRNDLSYRVVDCPVERNNQGVEGLSVEVVTGEEPLTITNIYLCHRSHPLSWNEGATERKKSTYN